ncbi:MAG: sigma-70 family RNA polymerase sigma factor [Prevotella sp.]|nr:sigma-70 family RNA polymerase sigma factor [Prevotella sp.]
MKDFEYEFEQMVRTHRSTIYTVCYMFSNDQDEVADLFQEVLINLWKSMPSFEERSDVRSWIYRVSLNVCISIDRKKRRSRTVPLTMDIDPYEETETNQNSRQMDMLRRRIARLGQFDRAIILLWLENMSYEEIAAIMGITVKNVSVRLYRIKEELKNMSNVSDKP